MAAYNFIAVVNLDTHRPVIGTIAGMSKSFGYMYQKVRQYTKSLLTTQQRCV